MVIRVGDKSTMITPQTIPSRCAAHAPTPRAQHQAAEQQFRNEH